MNDRQTKHGTKPPGTPHFAEDPAVLMRYLDGESRRGERMKINAHLLTCASCRREVGTYRSLGLAIAKLPPRRVPRDLSQRILMSVEADRRLRVRASATRASFGMVSGMKDCPPKPGSTVITSTWSNSGSRSR